MLIMVKGLALVFIILLMFAKTQYLWLAMCCYRMATHEPVHISHGWHLYYTLSGFSVAFGSTGCSGSAGGRASFAPLARTLSARGTNS